MKLDEAKALFILAGIEVQQIYELANQYDRDRKDPWWLMKTEFGLMQIGWRKRVISIEWADTAFRQVVTQDDVTKDELMVHAYSFAKAVEYLTTFQRAMRVAAETKVQQPQETA